MQHFTEANVNINGNAVYKAKVERTDQKEFGKSYELDIFG